MLNSFRFGFGDRCSATYLFVLNLAFSDLLYCIFNLPLYATTYLTQSWPLGPTACFIFAVIR